MSIGVADSALSDLLATTLENLPRLDFRYALKYQNYPAINEWFKRDKMVVDSGTQIKRNIVLSDSGNASQVRLYQKTALNVADVQVQLTAPWTQVQTYYSFERRELLRNRAPAQYINLLKSRRMDGLMSLANLLERLAWTSPQTSTDDLNPRGLPYWLVKAPAATTSASAAGQGAFNGATIRYAGGTTATDRGGIDSSTYARWNNWTAVYDALNDDFVKRLRKAFTATRFVSPMLVSDLKEGPASNYRIYMGLDELTEYETLVTQSNDNIGPDLDKFHGMTTFKRVPVVYAPLLDIDTENPVYGVNHSRFYPVVLRGEWMREGEPMTDQETHTVFTTFIDGSYQFLCDDVRAAGFVLSNTPAT